MRTPMPLLHGLIDVELWDKARWSGMAYLVSEDPTLPPVLGLIFENAEPAMQIFVALRDKLGNIDTNEDLRIAIIEGAIAGKPPGYSVHIGLNPKRILQQAEALGIESDSEATHLLISRVHRINPAPNSPHLNNFKKAYSEQGKYLLAPVTLNKESSESVTCHYELAIGKTEVHFRNVEDIKENELDAVIFANPE